MKGAGPLKWRGPGQLPLLPCPSAGAANNIEVGQIFDNYDQLFATFKAFGDENYQPLICNLYNVIS